jgi:hypothetical protein
MNPLLVSQIIFHINPFLGDSLEQHLRVSDTSRRTDSRSFAIPAKVAVHLPDQILKPGHHLGMLQSDIGLLTDIIVQIIKAGLIKGCRCGRA